MTSPAPTWAAPATRRRRPVPQRRPDATPAPPPAVVANRPRRGWKRWWAVVGGVTAAVFLGDLGQ